MISAALNQCVCVGCCLYSSRRNNLCDALAVRNKKKYASRGVWLGRGAGVSVDTGTSCVDAGILERRFPLGFRVGTTGSGACSCSVKIIANNIVVGIMVYLSGDVAIKMKRCVDINPGTGSSSGYGWGRGAGFSVETGTSCIDASITERRFSSVGVAPCFCTTGSGALRQARFSAGSGWVELC